MSCEHDLKGSGFTWNYSVVCNGDKRLDNGAHVLLDSLDKQGKVVYQHFTCDAMSPPDARQLASNHANGRILCFFDNHCLVHKDYFKRVHLDFGKYDIGLLHSTTEFMPGEAFNYSYRLTLKRNFWAMSDSICANSHKPFRCAAGGHGGFAVLNETWKEMGGYGPEKLFIGYAGEELTTDLRFWMRGKEVWLDPLLIHTHYVGYRGYARHYSDDYYINLMVSANILGGMPWLETVAASFLQQPRRHSGMTMFDLMQVAYHRSKDFAAEVQGTAKMSLEELLTYFREHCIPY